MTDRSARVNNVLKKLANEQADGLLITNLSNIFYLTGFTGSTAYLLITNQDKVFFTDNRYHEQFRQQVQGFELFDNSSFGFEAVTQEFKTKYKVNKLAFEEGNLTYLQYSILVKTFETSNLFATSEFVEEFRIIKDSEEIENLRKAIAINESVISEIFEWITPKVSEADIAAEHEYRIRKHGAKSNSFEPIIASGLNSAKPHAGFTERVIFTSAPLTMDTGCIYNGYCSDMTRTVFIKNCSPKWHEIYELVLSAKNAAADVLAEGKTGKEVDQVARSIITDGGYGDFFGHGLGHGVGINVHEAPRLSKMWDKPLPAGSIVTIEPGIYLPTEGGIRIEDMYLVTPNGCENLNHLSTDLRIIE